MFYLAGRRRDAFVFAKRRHRWHVRAMNRTDTNDDFQYSPMEEVANSISHGIGIALSIAGLSVLVTFAALHGDAWAVVSSAIYGASLVVLYSTSTLYHSFRVPALKRLLRKFDHAAIFLLIAGTYTPFVLGPLRGPLGWGLFGVVWGLALAGIVLKFWFTGRFEALSTGVYIGMGWLIVFALKPLIAAMSGTGIVLLVAGGLCYTGGVAFYTRTQMSYHHAIWHGFVLSGSICQYFAVMDTIIR
ncbi:MAG: hemolysin III family protein [Puniceicoccales bacterium]|jgi:hemolysin III|nr:hemolysin III family protein [Puniceicoccales bacterium]